MSLIEAFIAQFNNAAFKHPQDDVIHMGGTVESMDAMYKVNIRASYLLVQNLIPELEASKGMIMHLIYIFVILNHKISWITDK